MKFYRIITKELETLSKMYGEQTKQETKTNLHSWKE
jgi:hypothetical protein